MKLETSTAPSGPMRPEPFEIMEFQLALDLEQPFDVDFRSCVRRAAEAVGGEFLFEVPADCSMENASRIAAVRIPTGSREQIAFAALDMLGESIRLCGQSEISERLSGFAQAFVRVIERFRDGQRAATMPASACA
ncbi:hypothetical protein [Consotaella salsifontis]|uniref:Uncharacterized protein n=1 Tax=Consotaella salsifontis TaxID=1365950 RepID=A0A1T4MVI2_9HYPH|nr:hypothetical protein [Consotaella salsifontis]SJZ70854.1 hypothetical protein SAMN05428963_102304 [Consotaella salsifontis]